MITNNAGEPIVIGCNYHTSWQSHKDMRFVLSAVNHDRVTLSTRRTKRVFECSINDLIFIRTNYNGSKAQKILNIDYNTFKKYI